MIFTIDKNSILKLKVLKASFSCPNYESSGVSLLAYYSNEDVNYLRTKPSRNTVLSVPINVEGPSANSIKIPAFDFVNLTQNDQLVELCISATTRTDLHFEGRISLDSLSPCFLSGSEKILVLLRCHYFVTTIDSPQSLKLSILVKRCLVNKNKVSNKSVVRQHKSSSLSLHKSLTEPCYPLMFTASPEVTMQQPSSSKRETKSSESSELSSSPASSSSSSRRSIPKMTIKEGKLKEKPGLLKAQTSKEPIAPAAGLKMNLISPAKVTHQSSEDSSETSSSSGESERIKILKQKPRMPLKASMKLKETVEMEKLSNPIEAQPKFPMQSENGTAKADLELSGKAGGKSLDAQPVVSRQPLEKQPLKEPTLTKHGPLTLPEQEISKPKMGKPPSLGEGMLLNKRTLKPTMEEPEGLAKEDRPDIKTSKPKIEELQSLGKKKMADKDSVKEKTRGPLGLGKEMLEDMSKKLKPTETLKRGKSEKGLGTLKLRKIIPTFVKPVSKVPETKLAVTPRDPKARLVYYLNIIANEFGGNDIRRLVSLPSFNMLISIKHSLPAEQVFGDQARTILTMEEIESEIFWDDSLEDFGRPRLKDFSEKPNDGINSSSFDRFPANEVRFGRIPPSIGRRNRLTVWSSVYARIIDRVVTSSAILEFDKRKDLYLSQLKSKPMSTLVRESHQSDAMSHQASEIYILKQLVFLYQTILWTSRLCRLISLFSEAAANFAKELIEYQFFSTSSGQSSIHTHHGSVITDHLPSNPFCQLADTHPLSALRLFRFDRLFVQSSSQHQIGGGLIGILVLGSDVVDVESAYKTYGRELVAQQWISSKLIRLKVKHIRRRLKREMVKEISDRNKLFSIEEWLLNPLTVLSPLLVTAIDYKGFRVIVLPLFYRPPCKVNPTSLGTGNRIANELGELAALTGVLPFKKLAHASFDILQLEQESPPLVSLYKIHNILPREILKEASKYTFSPILRPELLRAMSFSKKLPSEYTETTLADVFDHNLSFNHSQLFDPYSIIAVSNASKGINQFLPPKLPASDLRSHLIDTMNELELSGYLHNEVITKLLRVLENQPFFCPYDSITFTEWIHSVGMNCRWIGQLLNSTRHVWVRQLVMAEIVGRTLKHVLYGCIRTVIFLNVTHQMLADENERELIAEGLPVPKDIGKALLDTHVDGLFQSILSSKNVKPYDKDLQKYSISELLLTNLLRLTFGTISLSEILWKEVIAVQSAIRFNCSSSLIRQSDCRPTAVLLAFQHHCGIELNIDATNFAARLDASASPLRPSGASFRALGAMPILIQQQRSEGNHKDETRFESPSLFELKDFKYWKCRVKLCLTIEQLRESLPLFDFIEDPSYIQLLPGTSIDQEKQPKLDQAILKTRSNESQSDKATPSQRYISKQLYLLLQACLNFNFQYQRQTVRELMEQDHIPVKSFDVEYIPLLNTLNMNLPSSILITSNRAIIQTSSWDVQMAVLEIAMWGMSEGLWEFGEFIALEALALFPGECLASTFSRWVISWCETHRGKAMRLPSISQTSMRRLFTTIFDLIFTHWDNRHPLLNHTLLVATWCSYVNNDLIRAQMFTKMAIQHAIDISLEKQIISFVDTSYLPTYPREVFDPTSKPLIDIVPAPPAESHLGHLFRLLGGLSLAQAARLYVLAQINNGVAVDIHYQNQSESLCDEAIESFKVALKILETCYAARLQTVLLASARFELAAALLLKLSLNKQDYGGMTRRKCLELSMEAYKTWSKTLSPHHAQTILSAAQLAHLQQQEGRNEEALKLWEECLDGINSLESDASSVTTARTFSLLSQLLFCLPATHFVGIYEADAPPGKSTLKVTRRLLSSLGPNPITLNVSNIKSNIITLYLNSAMAIHVFSDIFQLFRIISGITYELTQSSLGSLPSETHASIFLESTVSSQFGVAPICEIDALLEFIDSYPFLMSMEQLLSPSIKTCIPTAKKRVADEVNIEELLKQLVQCSLDDLKVFRSELPAAVSKRDIAWEASRESLNGHSGVTTKEKPKYSPIEHFLALRSPLEAYSFDSESLTVLCSILYHFLDVPKFRSFYLDKFGQSSEPDF